MPVPPLTAPPLARPGQAAGHAGRDSLTTPMLAVMPKSNGMSPLSDNRDGPLLAIAWPKLTFAPSLPSVDGQIRRPISRCCDRMWKCVRPVATVSWQISIASSSGRSSKLRRLSGYFANVMATGGIASGEELEQRTAECGLTRDLRATHERYGRRSRACRVDLAVPSSWVEAAGAPSGLRVGAGSSIEEPVIDQCPSAGAAA